MAGGDAPSGDDGTLEYCLYGRSISARGWAIVQRACSFGAIICCCTRCTRGTEENCGESVLFLYSVTHVVSLIKERYRRI